METPIFDFTPQTLLFQLVDEWSFGPVGFIEPSTSGFLPECLAGWWFQTLFIFPYSWDDDPI